MNNSSTFLAHAQNRVNLALHRLMAEQQSAYARADEPHLQCLKTACAYSISNGGKRLRQA